jgi:hypothetical protein
MSPGMLPGFQVSTTAICYGKVVPTRHVVGIGHVISTLGEGDKTSR